MDNLAPVADPKDVATKEYVDAKAAAGAGDVHVGTNNPPNNEDWWVDLNAVPPGTGTSGLMITVSDTAPATPAIGDLWLDTST